MNKFKILFPLIKAGSGSDIFTYNLVSGLMDSSIQANIQYFPRWAGYHPSVMGKMCDTSQYDLIHANTWNGFGFNQNIPLVTTAHLNVHDQGYKQYTTLCQGLYYRHIFRCERNSLECSDIVTTVSRYTQKKLKEIFEFSDSKLIYNGVNPMVFTSSFIPKSKLKIDETTTVLLFVGNHLRRKGSDLLVPIMEELGENFLLLTTAGLRTEKSIEFKNIRSLGKLNLQGLICAYNLCDILLFPSRLEGFGLTVAEAMSCGKPVVTTSCSSLPELIIDGKGGYLCPRDDVRAYADAIRHLAEDENLRFQMGKYNRQRVLDMFTIDRMTKEYINLYRKII